jgi:hypothetical protein
MTLSPSVPTSNSASSAPKMLEPDQWDSVLSRLTGSVHRGIEKIRTATVLDALGLSTLKRGLQQQEAKRLIPHMRSLGWQGPKALRFTDSTTANGYWRLSNRLPSTVSQPPLALDDTALDGADADDLPRQLENVTRLGLKELRRILRLPLDETNGNLLRTKVTAALGAINSQLRADEQQLKRKTSGDVLDRLEAALKRLEKTVPCGPVNQSEHELERSDAEASVMASRGDGSEG